MSMQLIKTRLTEFIRPWEDYVFGKTRLFSREWLKSLLKKLFMWSFREVEIRYAPIIKELKAHPDAYVNILEAGSGTLGLSQYMKREIIGVDIVPKGPRYKNITLITADAASLPFNDNTFDLVISMDMLEHVPERSRQKAVTELLRVSKKKVFLGMPCGYNAEEWEDKIWEVYNNIVSKWGASRIDERNEFFIRNGFMNEHRQCGLPKEKEVITYINEANKILSCKFKTEVIDNESVYVWYSWMLGYMRYNYLRWLITVFCFVIFFPVLARIRTGGCYRKIFIIKKYTGG